MRLLVLFVLAGCTVDHSGLIPSDASSADDVGPGDDAARDSGRLEDIGVGDVGLRDAGNDSRDAGPRDAGPRDAGPMDAGPMDAGPRDVGRDVDPCSVGPDSDGDGVVDACDECNGFDDGNDHDLDGVADGCDDWSCGERPSVAGDVEEEWIAISEVNIDGAGNTAVARAGENIGISFDWFIDDDGCSGCIDQVEWGLTALGRLGCVYSGNPPGSGESGSANVDAVIPTEGVYELRFNLGQNFFCDDIDWWGGEPSSDSTVGVICVLPPGVDTP